MKTIALTVVAVVAVANGVPAYPNSYDEQLASLGKEFVGCLDGHSRERVAAVDFTDLQLRNSELGRLMAEELSTELVRQGTGKSFMVLDRQHLQLILKEHQLTATGLVDPKNSKKLGQFAGIDTLITGNVVELESTIRLTVKALDTETAAILCASRGDIEKSQTMREIGAISIGSPTTSNKSTARLPTDEDEREEPVPTSHHGPLTVYLDSINKTSNGKKVQIVTRLTNTSEKSVSLTINPEELPVLLDNTGSEWTMKKISGIAIDQQNGQIHIWTAFEPGVDYPISFVFESEGSAGTEFSLTSTFLIRGGNPYKPTRIPVGLTKLRTR